MDFDCECQRLRQIDISDLTLWEIRCLRYCVSCANSFIRISPAFIRWRILADCKSQCFRGKLVYLPFRERVRKYQDFTVPLCIHNFRGSLEAAHQDLIFGDVAVLLSRPFLQSGLSILLYRLKEFFLQMKDNLREPLCTTFFSCVVQCYVDQPLIITVFVRCLLRDTRNLDLEYNTKVKFYFPSNSDCVDLHSEGGDVILKHLRTSLSANLSLLPQ